jgi:hypothetical protein
VFNIAGVNSALNSVGLGAVDLFVDGGQLHPYFSIGTTAKALSADFAELAQEFPVPSFTHC